MIRPPSVPDPGPMSDEAVCSEHDLRVMLHDDKRVARFGQAAHDAVDAMHVARMQADGRFVQNKQRVDEGRASAVVRLTRCTSPPESVRLCRSSVR